MSEAEVTQLIFNILGSDNNLRKTSEDALNNFKNQNPNEYITMFINLAKGNFLFYNTLGHSDQKIRSFAVVQLRKNLSAFSEKSFSNIWSNLNPNTQSLVKVSLFQILCSEEQANIRHQIADAIGEIGGTILSTEGKKGEWPDLISNIFQLISNNQPHLIEGGLLILSTLFSYASDDFLTMKNDLNTIFVNALNSNDTKIQIAGIQAVGSLVEVLETKDCKIYEDLLPKILEISYLMLSKGDDNGETALEVLSDIAEAEPKFFKKHFAVVFECMHKITFDKGIEDSGIKKMATETVISVGERIPKIFRDNKTYLSKLIEMIFCHMIEIEEEVSEEWKTPPEGFNEDLQEDADLEVVRFGMNGVDRLISAIGEKEMLPVLSQIVGLMFQQANWRYQHAAIMALSQVGEYVDDCNEIKPIIELVCKYADNPNGKIRYAVCHCVGQIADDMQPRFQETFHQQVMEVLIRLLLDPIPRVVSHSAAAITNFVEGMTEELIQTYLHDVLTKLFALLQNNPKNISIVKENAIAAIAATSEASGQNFVKYFTEATPFLFTMLNSHTSKEYRQLRGQLIECLTLIAHSVGWEHFKPVAEQLISIMITIQEGPMDATDPQKSYLLSGWQRLCIVMKKDFAIYLPKIVPSLFKLMENVFKESKEEPENIGKDDNINTYDTEEAEVAINMLSVIMEELKELFVNYVEPTTQLIIPLINFSTNENIRKSAAKCLPHLITALKAHDLNTCYTRTKAFLGILSDAVTTEFAPEIIIDQIAAMKDCIDTAGTFLSEQEITEFSNKILQFLMDSDKRKTEDEKSKNTEDMEEEEINLIMEDLETEEDLHVAIAELIGCIFKTHKNQCSFLVDTVFKNILPKVLQKNLSDKIHKFGIFIVDDMIEYLDVPMLSDKYAFLLEALINYSQEKTCFVRQAAVYGIGMFAVKAIQFINSNAAIINNCVERLNSALNIPQGTEKTKIYGHCKDNTVSAIGKIIKFHSDKIDTNSTLNIWFNNLPLKFDKQEAILQHNILMDLILSNPNAIFGENLKNLPKIIQIYGQIVDTKFSNAEIKLKIMNSLQLLKSNELVVNNWNELVKGLSAFEIKKLEACVAAIN